MKVFYILFLCLFIFFFTPKHLQGQQSGILKKDLKNAEYLLLSEEFDEALDSYLKILKTNPQNANINYRIGLCYLNIPGQKVKSIPYLKFASTHISEKYIESTINEVNAPIQTFFLLGTAFQINNEFDNAIKAFNDYKGYLKVDNVNEINFAEKQINSCNNALKMMNEPVKFDYEEISELIPPNKPSYYPVMSANGEVIVYKNSLKFNSPVLMAKKRNNKWTRGVTILPEIVSEGNCFPVSLSPEGTTLYLVIETGFDSDIYMSVFELGAWSPIKKLDKTINTKYWETYASISSDGKTLYFSSNRKGGIGGLDIYKSVLNKKGHWEPAINLGNTINTPYNEDNAVITGDEKTLYFSSQGHSTMGGYDAFKSVKQAPDSWSVPVNLGYPINTTDDNRYFYPIENGNKALYSEVLNPKNNQYTIKEIRFIPATSAQIINLKGKLTVQDNLSELNNSFRITIMNKETGEFLDSITPNPETGEFSFNVSPGNYFVEYKGSGYQSKTEGVSIPVDYPGKEFILNLNLMPPVASSAETVVNPIPVTDNLQPPVLPEYTILLAISSKRIPSTSYKNLEEITSENLNEKYFNGQYAYSLGKFYFKDMAEDYMKHSAFRPFPGAKVVKINEVFSLMPEMSEKNSDVKYGIQVMALKHPSDLVGLSKSGLLKSHECTDGFFRYIYGEYPSVKNALQDLQMIKDKGYPTAFIINYNKIKSISLPKTAINTPVNYSGKYTIQLKALKTRIGLNNFNNLENVRIIESDDRIFRYIYGEFNALDEANKELLRVRKLGNIDAFVRETETIQGYK